MEINYENLKIIVEKIPLPFKRERVYQELDFSIVSETELYIEINGRSYRLSSVHYPERKAFGFLSVNESPGTICFHYDAPVKDQRSWILHELAELELSVLGKSRSEAHDTAKEYEKRFMTDDDKNIQ